MARARPAWVAVAQEPDGDSARVNDDGLLRRGVIVRPMGSFGAPTALRITAGTLEEIAFLAAALEALLAQ